MLGVTVKICIYDTPAHTQIAATAALLGRVRNSTAAKQGMGHEHFSVSLSVSLSVGLSACLPVYFALFVFILYACFWCLLFGVERLPQFIFMASCLVATCGKRELSSRLRLQFQQRKLKLEHCPASHYIYAPYSCAYFTTFL